MSQQNISVSTSNVAIVNGPAAANTIIVQQSSGPPVTSFLIYASDGTTLLKTLSPGEQYVFESGATPYTPGATVGYVKVPAGTFTFTCYFLPLTSADAQAVFEPLSSSGVQSLESLDTSIVITDQGNGLIDLSAPGVTGVLSLAALTGALTLASADGSIAITPASHNIDLKAVAPLPYTVATLPATPAEGDLAYATDGRKVGELMGAGTGVPVYFSSTKWRVYSTDAQVAA